MAVVRPARRPGRLALVVLLAALLTALGMLVDPHDGVSAAPESRGADAAAGASFVAAVAPVRAVGRLAAEPSPLGLHGPAAPLLAGTMPGAAPPPALMRLGGQHTNVTPRLRAVRPTVGDRAPPVRLSDL